MFIYIYIFKQILLQQKNGLLGAQIPDNMREMGCPGWGWGRKWTG